MRLSDNKKSALYAAISDPIFTLRLGVAQQDHVERKVLDKELYALEREIVNSVWNVLNLDEEQLS